MKVFKLACIISTTDTTKLTAQDWRMINAMCRCLHRGMFLEGYTQAPETVFALILKTIPELPGKARYIAILARNKEERSESK